MILYLAALLATLVLMRFVGERNVFFAFAIYLPPLTWYVPLFALVPLCVLVWEWRSLVMAAVVVAAATTLFHQAGFRTTFVKAPHSLTVLTNNRGQHGKGSMKPFKDATKPDIMAFQEGEAHADRYLADPAYAEFKHGQDLDEFALVSRYPIVSVDAIKVTAKTGPMLVAARYVIDFEGQQIAIYNTHLPSPRDAIRYHMRGAFLYGLIGIPGTPLNKKRLAIQSEWDERISWVTQLVEIVKKETLPTLMVGDFNMPSLGWCHAQVTDVFGDAHAVAGSGAGFTFPGETHNPLAMGQPWMRIDYLFFDRAHWQCVESVTETGRSSQHVAVTATFELKK
jgi:endonuclease/exonuclease/phosphatase (EEP) superfamily protein YafD